MFLNIIFNKNLFFDVVGAKFFTRSQLQCRCMACALGFSIKYPGHNSILYLHSTFRTKLRLKNLGSLFIHEQPVVEKVLDTSNIDSILVSEGDNNTVIDQGEKWRNKE